MSTTLGNFSFRIKGMCAHHRLTAGVHISSSFACDKIGLGQYHGICSDIMYMFLTEMWCYKGISVI